MKILVFDNYDSFTYNLVHLVEKITHIKVDVHRNDQIPLEKVKDYDKIILSPGPGIPEEAGLLLPLIKLRPLLRQLRCSLNLHPRPCADSICHSHRTRPPIARDQGFPPALPKKVRRSNQRTHFASSASTNSGAPSLASVFGTSAGISANGLPSGPIKYGVWLWLIR